MKILSIALYDLKKMFRDKGGLIAVLVVPLVFTFVFGIIFGNMGSSSDKSTVLPVAVANHDKGNFTQDLLDELNQDNSISISLVNEDKLYDQVKSASVEAGFIIPKDFSDKVQKGEKTEIKVVKLPSSADYMVVETSINTAFTKLRIKQGTQLYFGQKMKGMDARLKGQILGDMSKKLDENLNKPDLIAVNESMYGSKTSDKESGTSQTARSTFGINLMFLLFTVIIGGAGTILDERKTMTWDRLGISPTRKSQIMAGKIIGTFLKGWFQTAILILFGKYVMGVNWGNSLPATIVVMSIYLLSGIGIGLFLSTVIHSNSQLTAISAVVIVSTSMLSGCYWPIEISPDFMQKLAKLFPQYWAMSGLKETVIANRGFDAIVKPLIILVGTGALFFLLAVMTEVLKGIIRAPKKAGTVEARA